MHDAFRWLRRSPGSALLALAILAVGIAATTVMFSVADPIVIQRLPFDRADRLVAIEMAHQNGFGGSELAPQEFLALRARQDVFETLSASGRGEQLSPKDGSLEATTALEVTTNLFAALRVTPIAGRLFTAENERPDQCDVALISYAFWQRAFGGDPTVIGRVVNYAPRRLEILGVMPPGFTYPVGNHARDVWVPWVPKDDERSLAGPSRGFYLTVVGRLKDGVTLKAARSRIEQISAGIRAETPAFHRDWQPVVRTLRESLFGRVSSWLVMLLGAVGLLLLMACSNVANLTLLRSAAREREIGIRLALGATRGRLIRTAVAEAMLLSGSATVLAVAIAYWSLDVVKTNLPAGIPRASDIAVDARVLVAAVVLGTLTTILVGLLPALRRTPAVLSGVTGAGRSWTTSRRGSRWHASLVIAQLALATTIVVAGTLFVASFLKLIGRDLGFDYAHVLSVRVEFPSASWATPIATNVLGNALLDRVKSIRGVEAAAILGGSVPLQGSKTGTGVSVPGREAEFRRSAATLESKRVTPDYFRALGVRLVRGRLFTDADRAGAPPVAILSESAVKRMFGSSDALGATITFNGNRTVVGIVKDSSLDGPEGHARPEGYLPFAQIPSANWVVVRAGGSVAGIVAPVTAAVHAVLPSNKATPDLLRDYFWRLTAERRFSMTVMSLIAGLALVLAIVGVYGVMANVVSQRTRDIGVRMALGASPREIIVWVLGQALRSVLVGSAIGLIAARTTSRMLTAVLFQLSPHDPVVYGAVVAILVVTALTAALIPARNAARVDPMTALRSE
ncbi:MAG: ABC transporter permease [Vicinamibacterales bacterium]